MTKLAIFPLTIAMWASAAACGSAEVVRGPASCERTETYKDEFGTTQEGGLYYFDNSLRALGLIREGQRAFLRVLWVSGGVTGPAIGKGTPAFFALKDQPALELAASTEGSAISGANTMNLFTQWAADFNLSADQLRRLAEAGVTAAKTQAGGIELAMPIPGDVQNRLQTIAICFSGGFPMLH